MDGPREGWGPGERGLSGKQGVEKGNRRTAMAEPEDSRVCGWGCQ